MLFLKHTLEQLWCFFIQVRACLLPKAEALERYPRSSELPAVPSPHIGRNDPRCGVYTNPIYLKGYTLGALVWPLPADANYRIKRPAPDPTHTIMNAENARLIGITTVGPFVYQRIQRV